MKEERNSYLSSSLGSTISSNRKFNMKYDQLVLEMPDEMGKDTRFWSQYNKSKHIRERSSNEKNLLTVIKATIDNESTDPSKGNFSRRMIDTMKIGVLVKKALEKPKKVNNGSYPTRGRMKSHKKELLSLMSFTKPNVIKLSSFEAFHDKHRINRIFSSASRNKPDNYTNQFNKHSLTRRSIESYNLKPNIVLMKMGKIFSEYHPKLQNSFCVTEVNKDFRIAKMKHQINKLFE